MSVPTKGGVARPPCEMHKLRGAGGDVHRGGRGPSRKVNLLCIPVGDEWRRHRCGGGVKGPSEKGINQGVPIGDS